MTDGGYYRCNSNGPLPAKWMAPESLVHREFTEKSDIWSFGVTCWEIFTRGANPYKDITHETLLDELKLGHRLTTNFKIDQINLMIRSCWDMDKYRRPTFTDLRRELVNIENNVRNERPKLYHQQVAGVQSKSWFHWLVLCFKEHEHSD